MHEDMALVWDLWCKGESLYVIAADLGWECSRLHQELRAYLDCRTVLAA